MNAVISPGNKARYADFCKDGEDIPVFLAPWWLDLDAGPDNWEVVLLENNGELVGALPFCFARLKLFWGIGMPLAAPYQGYPRSAKSPLQNCMGTKGSEMHVPGTAGHPILFPALPSGN